MAFRSRSFSAQVAAVVFAIIILCLAACAGFSATLKVKVPWDHNYLYWSIRGYTEVVDTTASIANEKPVLPNPDYLRKLPIKDFHGKVATIDVVPGWHLTVYDTTTGNEAIEHVSQEIVSKGLSLKKRDFDKVRRVRIKITANNGKPISHALVSLVDIAGRLRMTRVDPTTVGIAEFTDVTSGDATVQVFYGDGKKASQDIEIKDERDTPVFTAEVPVAGDVPTVKETASSEAGVREAKQEKAKKSGFEWAATLLGSLLGFLVLIGLIVGGYFYLKHKGVTVEDSLKKMGVELPEATPDSVPASATPAAPAVDPNVCQFCGQRKDANGNCACTIGAAPAPSGASTGPRLIGTQGAYAMSIFELTSDISTIGREADNTIPLPNDTTASRHHARIAKENGGFVLYDAGSSNGVFVNGEKTPQRALQPNDELQIGSTKFRFEM